MARPNQQDYDVPKAKLTRENLQKTLWLFSYLGRYKMMFVPGIIAVLITAGMSMAFPILMGELIGEAMNSDHPEGREALLGTVNRVAITLLIILSIQACITFFRMHLLGRAGDLAVADIRRDTYEKLVRLPMAFYNERRVGEISGHLAADLSLIRDTLCSTTPQFLRQCVMLLGGLTFLFILSPRLTFTMLLSLPVVLIAISLFGFRIRGRSREAQDLLAETNVIVDETLHGIADVKAFANEDYETRRYESGMKKYLKVAFELIGGRAIMVAMVIFALFGAITFVVWSGAHLLVDGEIARDAFTKFCFVTAFVGGAFAALPEIVSNIQKAVGATDRLRELFEEEPETDRSDAGKRPDSRASGRVEFQNVRFSYPSRPDVEVLKKVNFVAESGQRIAIVGPSGAGKSTIISLLLRFFDPTEGSISLDGKDLRELPLDWLRRQTAIVPQEVLLFGGSIYENIAYGRPGASEEDIKEAAKRANALEFIDNFPEGFESLVGERGVRLSGGQKQRIAIARAILANPSVLILDEATNALDAESERLVQEALDDLMRDRTSLIVAHRLSTVRNADQILVLSDGQIIQQGSHDQLVEDHDGLYRMLSQLQLS
tara:strand:- start:5561 stop:7372 length:1812 start_codon:yes stop_codon:yes gene_type:complete